MRRRSVVVLALAALLVLSGCGAGFGPAQPRPTATPAAAMTCSDSASAGVDTVPAGVVPDGFTVAALHRCEVWATREEADGTIWSGTRVERLEGDFAPFLEAISAPSDPRSLGPCTADAVIMPELWAEDANGRFVRLSYPVTGCGKPKSDAVDGALSRLDVTGETFTPSWLVESPAATSAGCATQAGVTVLVGFDLSEQSITTVPSDPEQPGGGATGVPVEPPALPAAHEVDGLRVCSYTSEPPPAGGVQMLGDAGAFTAAEELGQADAVAALDAVRGAPAADDSCSQVASRFVVAHPLVGGTAASSFTVELDGCRRVIDPALRALVAPPELLALLG